ncbi:MAG: pyridoxal phosphate-dependent aminotransferase, partial [Tepidanaerobacteraceae bacterium]|nr:pyridoxal phosphate-dependent aminotransferase [Tepidanaerobacteraceae bacterium]
HDQITVSNGAKQSLYNALYCLIDPGDKVLIPSPYWVSYPEMVKLCGGIPVFVPMTEDNGFMLKASTLEQYIDNKTKILIINSPNNPCGSVYSKQDLKEISDLAIKNNIFVITDEIYQKLIYDGSEHVSIVSNKNMPERSLLINGVSKSFAMTGWRIGFAAGPKELIKAMTNFQSHSTSNPNSIAQKASLEAFSNPSKDENIKKMINEFLRRRNYMVQRINSINNISCRLPMGAFYVFMNISGTFGKQCDGKIIKDSTSFSAVLLEKYKVALVPGIAFGDDNYVRLSYATSIENIKKGLDRIERFVEMLK